MFSDEFCVHDIYIIHTIPIINLKLMFVVDYILLFIHAYAYIVLVYNTSYNQRHARIIKSMMFIIPITQSTFSHKILLGQ